MIADTFKLYLRDTNPQSINIISKYPFRAQRIPDQRFLVRWMFFFCQIMDLIN